MKRRQTNQTTTQGAWSRVTEGVSDPMTVDIASRRCVEVGGSRVVVDYQRGPVYRVKGVQYAAGVQMFVDSVSVTRAVSVIPVHPLTALSSQTWPLSALFDF